MSFATLPPPPPPPPPPRDFRQERARSIAATRKSTSPSLQRTVSFHASAPDGTLSTQYNDGSQRQVKPDGTLIEAFPDGTRRTARPDGGEVIVHSDGYKFQRGPDGTELISDPKTGRRTQTSADGNIVIDKFQDGTTIQTTRDKLKRCTSVRVAKSGEKLTSTPDGITIASHINGSLHQSFPDGTVIFRDVDGTSTSFVLPPSCVVRGRVHAARRQSPRTVKNTR